MDINLLVLNVGNSRVSVGAFLAGELQPVVRVPIGQRKEWEGEILRSWRRIAESRQSAVAAASVNPEIEPQFAAAVEAITGQEIQWVGRNIELPIEVHTQAPSETG